MDEFRICAPRVEKPLHLGVRGGYANAADHPDGPTAVAPGTCGCARRSTDLPGSPVGKPTARGQ